MADPLVIIRIENLDRTAAALKDMSIDLDRELETVLDEAAAYLLDVTRKRFLAETDPDGNPWEPSFSGLRRRSKGDTGTLFDTGSLFHSIDLLETRPRQRVIGVNPATINTRTGEKVEEYAIKHQEGIGPGIVQRKFIGVSFDDESVIDRLLQARIGPILNRKF